MKLSVAVSERSPEGVIPGRLREAKFLFIAELEGMQIEKIFSADEDAELLFAKMTAESGCETIICGDIENEAAFAILNDRQISRLNGGGMTANQAVKAMIRYELPYIQDRVGGEGCKGGEIAGEMGIDVLGRKIVKDGHSL